MGQRKLSRRQAWRIQKIQEERRRRARKRSVELHSSGALAELGPEQSGLVIANYGANLEVEAGDGSVYWCVPRQNLDPLVVGDEVVWQPGRNREGVVVALQPRRSALTRPLRHGAVKPLAANLDQILVVLAPRPAYSRGLVDRYLVAAETTGIRPLLVLNKTDLLDPAQQRDIDADLTVYQRVGYTLLHASTEAEHGLAEVLAELRGHTSVFVGQSGTGKSSLVNAIMPDSAAKTGEISAASGLGRHTTSTARLYHLPTGGHIIDSPGVRDFRLGDIDADTLAHGFVEFRPHLGACRFRDCRHLEEPGCALKAAVEAGAIDAERFESFLQIRAELGLD